MIRASENNSKIDFILASGNGSQIELQTVPGGGHRLARPRPPAPARAPPPAPARALPLVPLVPSFVGSGHRQLMQASLKQIWVWEPA